MKRIIIVIIFNLFIFLAAAEDYDYPYRNVVERDPLRSLVNEDGKILIREDREVGDLFLQGIIDSPEGSVVIINNEMFHEGDVFEKYKIKKIKGKGVIIEKGGKEYFLKWEE